MTSAAIAIIIYVLALVSLVWATRRQAERADMFNIFGRRAGALRATAGYLSLIGAGELITLTQLGFDNGYDLLWFPGGIAAGFLSLAIFGDFIRVRAQDVRANTLVGYVDAVYGRAASTGLALVFLIALGSLLVIQFIVGGQLLEQTAGIPVAVSRIGIGLVIVAYLVIGGYVAVLSTDVIRLFLLALIVLTLGYVGVTSYHASATPITAQALAPYDRFTLFVLGLFGAICAGDVWQAVLASASRKVLRSSMILAAGVFLCLGLLVGLLGIATREAGLHLNGSPALVIASSSLLGQKLAPLVALIIVGSIMATADTEIWVLSSSLVSLRERPAKDREEDVRVPRDADGDEYQDRAKRLTQLTIPIVTALAVSLSYATSNAQEIYSGLLVLLTSIAPPVFLMILGVTSSRAGISFGLWGGVIAFVTLATTYHVVIPPELTFAPVVVSLAFLLVGLGLDARRSGVKV